MRGDVSCIAFLFGDKRANYMTYLINLLPNALPDWSLVMSPAECLCKYLKNCHILISAVGLAVPDHLLTTYVSRWSGTANPTADIATAYFINHGSHHKVIGEKSKSTKEFSFIRMKKNRTKENSYFEFRLRSKKRHDNCFIVPPAYRCTKSMGKTV